MKYTIEWSEVTKTGVGEKGPWKLSKMNLKDEQGNVHENVATFQEIMTGQELEGSIEEEVNGQYVNKKFKSSIKRPTNPVFNKTAQMEKVMDKKAENIARSQDNKELGIKTSSTIRMAVDCAIAEGKVTPEAITSWRNWFLKNWDIIDTELGF